MGRPVEGAVPAVGAVLPDGLVLGLELGRGARSVVYRAQRDGAAYAVKVLTESDEDEVVAFRREAALLASLRHPGLVNIHEVGMSGGRPYLVMDLVDGETLADAVGRGPLAEVVVARWAAEIAAVLAVAHRAGVVHRDLKPENVLITADGQVRLIDFGLAGRIGISTEAAVGTFRYSAPEQTGMLHRPVDGRTDLYALGVVIFECLTGAAPFESPDVGELIRLHLSQPAADLHGRPGISDALAATVAELLAKDPDDRWQSAEAVGAELTRIAGGPAALAGATGQAGGLLVGRTAELRTLTHRWTLALGGRGQAVLLTGDPGSGKTRLIRELTATAAAAGRAVLSGHCGSDAMVPFTPIREAVETYLAALPARDDAGTRALTRLRAATADYAVQLAPLSQVLTDALDLPAGPATAALSGGGDQFSQAIAQLLAAIAQTEGGAVLHIDDGQWCDAGTRAVLRRLAPLLAAAPLLVVVTGRDNNGDDGVWAELTADLSTGAPPPLRLTLAPLSDAEVSVLLADQLGAAALNPELVRLLAGRAGGNPLVVREYLRAVIDAGLLLPYWGQWLLDESGLAALALPDDVMDLVLRQVGTLDEHAREQLTAAAALGDRFDPAVLAATVGADHLADAVTLRLIERGEDGQYVFVHDRIRHLLLDRLDHTTRRALHQQFATALDRADLTGDAAIVEIAGHYLAGQPEKTPARAFAAAAAAGAILLRQHASAEAMRFLTGAETIATTAGLPTTSPFHADAGLAAARTGDYERAVTELTHAVNLETDPHHLAPLLGLLAGVHLIRWDGETAMHLAIRGLAELGRRLPANPVLQVFSMLRWTLWAILLGLLPARRVVRHGAAADTYRHRVRLMNRLTEAISMAQASFLLMTAILAQTRAAARRLGPSVEFAETDVTVGFVWGVLGARRRSHRMMDRGMALAAGLRDPGGLARVAYVTAGCQDAIQPMSRDTGRLTRQLRHDHGPWMELGTYLNLSGTVAELAIIRGHLAESARAHREGTDRSPDNTQLLGSVLAPAGARIEALAGRHAEAARQLTAVREFLAAGPNNVGQRINVALAAVHLAVEQDDHGAEFEAAVAEFRAFKLSTTVLWTQLRAFWIYQAQGRLAQATAAEPARRADRIAAAAAAVAELGKIANGPALRAYHQAAQAALWHLRGDHRKALRLLNRLQGPAAELDLPLLEYEIARTRARVSRDTDQAADAQRHARTALALATEHGWATRARWIRSEFGVSSTASVSMTSEQPGRRPSTRGVTAAPAGGWYERRQQALQQVSLAAINVVDPAELAVVALTEIVDIFAAERAFLFLREGDTLVPYLGRDSTGTTLAELTGYGSTLVRQVDESGEPVVVTGSEQGEALGSRSTVVYGLRSIMIAPLILAGRPVGVAYLDSRAAKGIFTPDDLDMLAAITNHIALALETARAAQLEMTVRVAERDRDIAHLLREATQSLTASLDPADVEHRLIGVVSQALHTEHVVLIRPTGTGDYRLVSTGVDDGTQVDAAADPVLAGLLDTPTPCRRTAPAPTPLPGVLPADPAGWLAVPLTIRGQPHGILLATSARPVTEAETDLAAALAGQGMTALDNALLYREVERLAGHDSLTNLLNRRQFYIQAENKLTHAGQPAAVLMIDIDHFKVVNDTHGHAAGDDVIREVSARLANALRSQDVICRYGGEEFAVLLSGAAPTEARVVADRVNHVVAARPIDTVAGPLRVTVSVGLVDSDDPADELNSLLRLADTALYQAKGAGRNRVAVAPTRDQATAR